MSKWKELLMEVEEKDRRRLGRVRGRVEVEVGVDDEVIVVIDRLFI